MFLKIGHRGAAGHEPENTTRSFLKAIELGADMVEFDVHVIKDGNIAIIHDKTLFRTTNGKGRVSRLTVQKLKTLKTRKNETVPLLEEALDAISGKIKVNIELKGRNTAIPVSSTIKEYIQKWGWRENDFLISSFNITELTKFKKALPEINTGIIFKKPPRKWEKTAEKIGAYSINVSKKYTTEKLIIRAHELGLKIFVWTVNSKKDAERFILMGADGAFSDYPDRLKT